MLRPPNVALFSPPVFLPPYPIALKISKRKASEVQPDEQFCLQMRIFGLAGAESSEAGAAAGCRVLERTARRPQAAARGGKKAQSSSSSARRSSSPAASLCRVLQAAHSVLHTALHCTNTTSLLLLPAALTCLANGAKFANSSVEEMVGEFGS